MDTDKNKPEKTIEKAAPVWKCKCPCHKGALVDHPVPCCIPCPHCKKVVARGLLKEHLKDCKTYPRATRS